MRLRIRIISACLFLGAAIILVRLYSLQILQGTQFRDDAQKQYVNTNTTAYDRGDIYFLSRNGDKTLAAMTRTGSTLAIHPSLIKDPESEYKSLSSVIDLDKTDFMTKAAKSTDPYEEVAHKINQETIDKVRGLDLSGLIISDEKWRYYPGDSTAAQVIGFVSYKGNNLVGSYGLEKYYEDTLKRDPTEVYNNFFAQLFSNIKTSVTDQPSQGSLVTTIEPSVQSFLEQKLAETRAKWSSDEAGGIIINPVTGEIYAMAFNPTFDLNNFQSSGSTSLYNDPLVSDAYEMGSIIKAITMASGLDSNTVTASSTYDDPGCETLNSKKICNYDGRARGVIPMQQVLNQSLNMGAAYVALKIGNQKFADYLRSFGFGTETGIDLPNEGTGIISNLDSKRQIEIATAAYGQGISLTPIQTVRALSVLANGGKLITPHIVKEIDYDSGFTKKIIYDDGKQVIKPETSKEITRMLINVVDVALANGTVKNPQYSIAAKTGTAEMADEGRAGYVPGKYLHSFFGYFPATNPKFLVFLFHTYPKNVQYASETLTQPFMDITNFLINYYDIPPDRNLNNQPQ